MLYRQPKPDEVLEACSAMWRMDADVAFINRVHDHVTYPIRAFRACYASIMSNYTCWSAKNIGDEVGVNHAMIGRSKKDHDHMLNVEPLYAMSYDMVIDKLLRIMRTNDRREKKMQQSQDALLHETESADTV